MINFKNYRIVELNNGKFAFQLIKGFWLWRKPVDSFLDIKAYKRDGAIAHYHSQGAWFVHGCQADTIEELEACINPTPADRPFEVKREAKGSKLDKVLK